MTKKESQDILTEAGITDFDESLNAKQLAEAYPAQLGTDSDDDSEDEDSDEKDEDEAPEGDTDGKSISFKVRSMNNAHGHVVRTFSEEEHGKDYKKVAAEFAATNKAHILK